MFEKVSSTEFIRRLTWLAKRFPNYKIRGYTWYHDGVYEELKKLGIPYERYYGFYYNTMAEDICDYGVYLNIDQTEILDFTMDLENEEMSRVHFGIQTEKEMLRVIFKTNPPESLIIQDIKQFVKEMTDNLFMNHPPIEFAMWVPEKRKGYVQVLVDNDEEKVTIEHNISEHRYKKIKIQ